RLQLEGVAENLRGAVDILAAVFDLLDAFPKFLKEFRDGAIAGGILGGQNIHREAAGKMEFKFLGVLVGRDVRESGRAASFANFREALRSDGKADGDVRIGAFQQFGKFLIDPPRENSVVGEGAALAMDFRGGDHADLGFRRGHAENGAGQGFFAGVGHSLTELYPKKWETTSESKGWFPSF